MTTPVQRPARHWSIGGHDAVEHLVADGVHLGLEGNDADAGVDRRQAPQAHAVVLEQRLAGLLRRSTALAEHALGEDAGAGRPAAPNVRRRHSCERNTSLPGACTPDRPDSSHPGRQRRLAHGLAGGDVGGDRLGDVGPAGGLPDLERALRPAEAPAHRQIEVAGIVGNVLELHRAVVEQVAEDGPQELGLRMA